MKARTILWLLAPALMSAILLVVGCDSGSAPNPQEVTSKTKSAASQLPEWLQKGPDDWGQDVWLSYQASLIKMRTPMLRAENYTAEELETVTSEVEHFPGDYEDKIKQEWLVKWKSRLESYELTGGCGCCNEIYTVTGPKAAIEEFPQYYRRNDKIENGGE